MGKITVGFSDNEDLITTKHTKEELLKDDFCYILDKADKSESKAFVCFQAWKESEDYKYEHSAFLVTQFWEDINAFYIEHIKDVDDKDIDFYCLGFDSYREAFLYCIDLKEGL